MTEKLRDIATKLEEMDLDDEAQSAAAYVLVADLGLERPAARFAFVGRDERILVARILTVGIAASDPSRGNRPEPMLEAYLRFCPTTSVSYQMAIRRLAAAWKVAGRTDERALRLYKLAEFKDVGGVRN